MSLRKLVDVDGITVLEDGTVITESDSLNFGSNLSLADDGGGQSTASVSDPLSIGDLTATTSFTDPAGVTHTDELADIDDVGATTTAGGFPNTPDSDITTLSGVNIADGATHSTTLTIPDGYALAVYALGVQDSTNSAPTGLTAELYDVTNNTVVLSKNEKLYTETLAATYHGSTNSAIDVELRISNSTGGTVDAFGQFEARLYRTRLDPYDSNPIWTEADYTWSTNTPDNPAILRDPETGEPKQYNNSYWMGYSDTVDSAFATSSDLLTWSASGDGAVVNDDEINCLLDMRDIDAATDNFYATFWTGSNIRARTSNDLVTWTDQGLIGSNLPSPEDFRLQLGSDGVWYAVAEEDGNTSGVAVRTAQNTDAMPTSEFTDEGPAVESSHGLQFVANPTVMRRDMGEDTYYEIYYEGRAGLPPDIVSIGAWVKEENFHDPTEWNIWGTEGRPITGSNNSIRANSLIKVGNETWAYHTHNSATSKELTLYRGPSLLQ